MPVWLADLTSLQELIASLAVEKKRKTHLETWPSDELGPEGQ